MKNVDLLLLRCIFEESKRKKIDEKVSMGRSMTAHITRQNGLKDDRLEPL